MPVLLVQGEQGSAKTFLLKIIRALLDPSSLATLAPPDNLREFIQQAAHHRTLYLDNLSYLPDWLSDALCRLCTGEGFSKRELYTDDDDIVYSFRGLGGMSSISAVATKSDLLDRSLILRLEPIPESKRREEAELWGLFQGNRPYLLGAMFDALSKAMHLYPSIKLAGLPRLADFARWGYAIALALGHEGAEFLEAYGVNVASQNDAALVDSPLAQALLAFVHQGCIWTGTATQLLSTLESRAEALSITTRSKSWPKSPSALSRRLGELIPNLRRVGILVTEKTSGGIKTLIISREVGGNAPPAATATTLEAGPALERSHEMPLRTHQMPLLEGAMPSPGPMTGSYESGGSSGSSGISPHFTAPAEDIDSDDDVGEV
jgi:hypothetical protein